MGFSTLTSKDDQIMLKQGKARVLLAFMRSNSIFTGENYHVVPQKKKSFDS
jgi:hypothetical protein